MCLKQRQRREVRSGSPYICFEERLSLVENDSTGTPDGTSPVSKFSLAGVWTEAFFLIRPATVCVRSRDNVSLVFARFTFTFSAVSPQMCPPGRGQVCQAGTRTTVSVTYNEMWQEQCRDVEYCSQGISSEVFNRLCTSFSCNLFKSKRQRCFLLILLLATQYHNVFDPQCLKTCLHSNITMQFHNSHWLLAVNKSFHLLYREPFTWFVSFQVN